MMKMPDFEGLAMFAKVAEEGSFAAAARAMGVSVTIVSRGVARLDERLGARLFNRTSRRLALTEFGRTTCEKAGEIDRQAEEAESAAREMSVQPRGRGLPGTGAMARAGPGLRVTAPGYTAPCVRCRSSPANSRSVARSAACVASRPQA